MPVNHRSRPVLLAAIALAIAVPAAHGQSRKKGKDADKKADYKVMIFDDEFHRGKNVIIRRDVADLNLMKFSDHSESLKWNLAPGRAAVLFDEKNFNRPVLVLVGEGEVLELGKEQPNALHNVSSVAFVPCKKGAHPRGISRDVVKVGEEE